MLGPARTTSGEEQGKATFGSSTVYIGDHYEQTGSTICRNYYANGRRVAVRVGGVVYWLHADHLGSATLTTDLNGNRVGELRYTPYGITRYEWGSTPTNHRYTGQRWEGALGLYDYRARYYDPALGRFVQADTIVPQPGNPQSLNRYAYVLNNPLRYTDPTGHAACIDDLCDLLHNPVTQRPMLRMPAPRVITYIYEMTRNAQSPVAQVIAAANGVASLTGGAVGIPMAVPVGAKSVAAGLWGSQVMDARVKGFVGPLAPLLGNWDHKPTLYPKDPQQRSPVPEIVKHRGWSTVGSALYRYDIWSNIHYGYVGRASGFSQPELTGSAGIEQIGSDFVSGVTPHRSPGADMWAASWDHPSDYAAIQIGIRLWDQYGLAVRPADLYLAVLEEPRLATRP